MTSRFSLFAGALLVSSPLSACAASHPTEPKPLGVSSIEPEVGSAPNPVHQEPALVRRIESLAEQLTSCRLERAGPSCEAWTAWQEIDWRDIEIARATVYGLLASADDAVRFAAVYALALDESSITDAERANQLVSALEAEQSSTVLVRLVRLVGQIDFTQNPAAGSRVLDLMEHSPSPATRANIFFIAMKVPGVEATLLRMFDAGTLEERTKILAFIERIESGDKCPILDHALADQKVAQLAFVHLATGSCPALRDKGIAWLPTAKLDPQDDTVALYIGFFCMETISDAQRSGLLAQAKRLAKAKGPAQSRVYGLHSVLKCDPANGRSFVRGFVTDPDRDVAAAARDASRPTWLL